MSRRERPTRRSVLAGTAAAAGATAGCFGVLGGDTGEPADEADDGSTRESATDDGWPMSAGTPALSGHRPANVPPDTGSVVWTADLPGRAATAPVVGDGIVAVATSEPAVVALDAGSGEVRWEQSAPSLEHGGLATAAERVVHLSGDGTVTALDRETGDQAWQRAGDRSRIRGAPTVTGDTVVVPRRGEVLGLGVAEGDRRWRLEDEGAFTSTVAVGEDLAAYTTPLGGLGVFDPADGTRLRSFDAPASVGVGPTLVEGTAIVQTTASSVHAVDLDTGVERWSTSFQTGGLVPQPAAIDDLAFVVEPAGGLHAIDVASGASRWEFSEQGSPVTAGSVVDERVFLVAGEGTFCDVDVGTGSLHWSLEVGYPARRPAVAGGRAFVATGDRLLAVS